MLHRFEAERQVARYQDRQMMELVAETPLAIQIVPPPKSPPPTLADLIRNGVQALRRDKWLAGLAGAGTVLVIFLLGLWIAYVFPQEVTELQPGVGDLYFAVGYSPWVAIGDEEILTLTLANNGHVPLTGVKAYLVFSDTLPVAMTLEGGNTADFGNLAAGERKTRSIAYRLDKHTADTAQAELWVSSAEQEVTLLRSCDFSIAPVPRVRSVLTRLLSMVALGIYTAVGVLLRGALKGVLPEVK